MVCWKPTAESSTHAFMGNPKVIKYMMYAALPVIEAHNFYHMFKCGMFLKGTRLKG